MKTKTAATVTIHRAADMTARGRKAIARWLLRQAQTLLAKHDKLAPRYIARYYYE